MTMGLSARRAGNSARLCHTGEKAALQLTRARPAEKGAKRSCFCRGSAFERARERRKQFDHLRENARIGGDHFSAVQKVALAGEIADQPARLGDEQAAGCDIPGVEPDLPE